MKKFEKENVEYKILDTRKILLLINSNEPVFECVLNRSIGQTEGLDAVSHFEMLGAKGVNSSLVISCCGDKAQMTRALERAGVPIPKTAVCYSAEMALKAAEEIGYPVVLKPIVGSWGRMVARLDNEESARMILEYKAGLPALHHKIIYLQEYVEKPGRDIRAVVVGDDVVAVYFRHSDHWITNVKRGGRGVTHSTTGAIAEISLIAARAVGGGVLSVDLLEHPSGELLVNEVNHTMEFGEATAVTGVDIAKHYVRYCLDAAA